MIDNQLQIAEEVKHCQVGGLEIPSFAADRRQARTLVLLVLVLGSWPRDAWHCPSCQPSQRRDAAHQAAIKLSIGLLVLFLAGEHCAVYESPEALYQLPSA